MPEDPYLAGLKSLQEAVAGGFAQVDARFAQVDARFARLERRLENLDDRVSRNHSEVIARLDALECRVGRLEGP